MGFKAKFSVDLPGRLRVTKRLLRWVSLAVAAILVVSVGVVAEPDRDGHGFPVGGLRWLLGGQVTAALPVVGGLPVQQRGDGRGPQRVSAADTSAHTGSGRAPGSGAGALPAANALSQVGKRIAAPGTTPSVAGAASFSPERSKRIASAASSTSDVYSNPDGSYTRKVFQNPVNVKTADGSYVPIDTSLQHGADGRLRQKNGDLPLDLAPTADESTLATVRVDATHSMSYSLAGAAKVAPQIDGAAALYPGVLPGVDLRVEARAAATKESLILHSASAPTSYRFPLKLQGLTARLEADGSVTLHDQAGATRVTIPAGSMDDSKLDKASGSFAHSDGVRYALEQSAGGQVLTITLDSAWLNDPARVFPVTVDPSVSLASNGDTFASTDYNSDQSGSDELRIGTYNGGASKSSSYIRFGTFGATFAGAKMNAVNLNLFNYHAYTCNTPEPFEVREVTEAWTPQTVKSYPGPAFDKDNTLGSIAPNVPGACTGSSDITKGNLVSVPLNTALFQSWAQGGPNNGLMITASQTDSMQWKKFVSDNGPANLAPYLSVTYTAGISPQVDAQYPANGYAASTLTPELLVAAHDPDSSPAPLTFDFAVYSSGSPAVLLKESGWVASRSWVVPAGVLAWGQSYYWTVTANDGYSTSVSQTENVLTTPVPQPLITSSLAQNGGQGFDPSVANYTTYATDATVETVGPALAVTRSYNSQDPRVGSAFGSGWSSVVDTRATEQKDSAGLLRTVLVTYPGGQEVVFGRNADGSFAAPMGRYATFSAASGGGYRLVDKDGTVYTFTTATGTTGRFGLSSIADSQGRTEKFGYDTSNRLATMTAVSGRALHVTWTLPSGASSQHVATVYTDSDAATPAETWRYSYTGDLLSKVCPPTSTTACATYGYQTGSLYPTALTDANPHSYWRLGESAGPQAISAMVDNYGTDNGTYSNVTLGQAGPLAGSAGTSAAFNGTTSRVELPAKLVTTGSYLTVAMWFKASPGDSGPLFSYQADPITNPTTAGNYTPALYIGTSGQLHGQFWDDKSGSTIDTTASVADGNWHHVVLSGAGSQQWMYLDGALVGTETGTIETVNTFSVAHEYFGAGFWGGGWPDEPHTVTNGVSTGYAAYFKGSISDGAYFDRSLSAAEVATIYGTAKVASHPLHTVTRASGNVTATIDYDPASGRLQQVTDANGGVWKLNPAKVSGSSQVYASSVLGANPTDYWRLGETGTTDAINEVNGSTATYDSVKLGVGGPFNDAKVAEFDGAKSNIRLPSGYIPATGPESVSLWFKTTTPGRVLLSYQAATLADASTTANYTPALYVGASGKLLGRFWHGTTTLTTPKAVTDNVWHHVVLAAGTASQSMYLDGALVGTTAGTVAATGMDNVYLGAGFLGGSWPDQSYGSPAVPTYYHGQIGEVAFYRTQLTAAQVSAQFTARDTANGVPVRTVGITDPTGKAITHVYDVDSGQELSETDSLGFQTQYGYDVGGFLHTVIDPKGNVTTTDHDVRGNTVASTTCQDKSAQKCSTNYYTYYPDATTKVLSPDPRNDVMLTMRDGRSASSTDNTFRTTFSYDAAGNRTAVTDPLGRTTTTGYTDGTTVAAADGGFAPAGLPMTLTTAGGASQTVVYFSSGDVATVTDPAGKVTAYTYDVLGRVKTKKDTTDSYPAGLTTSYQYDALDRLVQQTDPATTNRVSGAVHTQVTTTKFDDDGLVKSTTLADATGGDASRTETMTYNPHGQQWTVIDANQQTTTFEYDLYGNPVKEVDPDGGEIDSAYDTEGNLLSTTLKGYIGDPNNPSPATDLVVERLGYDPAGRLATRTDTMGWVTAYTYTDNGLPATTVRKDPSTGASFTVQSLSYDAAGNLTKKVTGNGAASTTYAVDPAGRPSSSTFDPDTLKRTSTYTYNRDDQLTNETLTDPSGLVASTDNMYDPMGRVISETTQTTALAPVLRYRLNQSAADAGGNNTGTAAGVTWSTDHGGSAKFTGAAGSVVTSAGPAVDTAGSFTVSAWVDLTGNAAAVKAVSATGAKQDGFELRYDKDVNRWRFAMKTGDTAGAGTVVATSTSVPALNTWTHLTGVYDAVTGAMRLYVNGALQGSASNLTPFTARGPLLVGAGTTNGTRDGFFTGEVSDVQVYSRVLTATEITSVYGGTAPAADAGVVRRSYGLDQYGLARTVTDPNGAVTNNDYDEAGLLTVTTGPTVQTERNGGAPVSTRPITLAGFDTFGEQVEERDPNGNVVLTGYDAEGNELTTKLPSYTPPGSTTAITPTTVNVYDKLGQLTSTTDPLLHVTKYDYDQLGRMSKVTQHNGAIRTYTYDGNGDELSDTDPTGAKTTATYDYLGRPLTSTEVVRQDNASYTTNYTYGADGLLATVKSPAGVLTTTKYNAAGEPTTEIDGANDPTTYTYDAAGRPVKSTLSDGSSTVAGYDMAGREISNKSYDTTGAFLRGTSSKYDRAGNEVASTDARNTTSTFTYDPTGLITSQVQPISATDSITTTFGYDAGGNRTRFTDGRGHPFLTTYNAWDLPESTIEPATTAYPNAADRTFTVGYDANAQPKKVDLPGGVSVAYGYDTVGNLTTQTGTGAEVATGDRTFGYDLADRLTSAKTTDGIDVFTYDDRDALRTATGPSGASTFTYTPDGLVASRADAAGSTSYGYDTADRLKTMTNPAANLQATLSYDNLSNIKTIVYGTGDTRSFGYDSSHRLATDELKTSTNASVAKITYGYDANDNLTSKNTAGFAGSGSNVYTYDLANRLTSWTAGSAATQYAYDKSGNRTQVGSRTFTYDERNMLRTSSDGSTYSYTPRGTLKSTVAGGQSLNTQNDAFGQTVSQQASGGAQETYKYDAMGRVLRTGFSYTGLGNDLASDGTTAYTRDPDNGLVAETTSTAKRMAWTDQHDDVVGQFDPAGTSLAGSMTYDPLGKVLASTGMIGGLGYQSEWTDTLTGRVDMLSRWYNTDTGQFDNRDSANLDPVDESVSADRYAYADDNPLGETDPSGEWGVPHILKKVTHAVTHYVAHKVTQAVHVVSHVYHKAVHVAKKVVHKVRKIVHRVVSAAKHVYRKVKHYVRRKVSQGRRWVAHKISHVKHRVSQAYHRVKQAGKAVAARTARVAKRAASKVHDAYAAAEKSVKDHKNALIEIAAIGVGILGALACTAVTAGAGAVACMVGAAALINVVKDSAEGNIHDFGDFAKSAGVGALQGAAGGAGGAIGGKIAAGLAGKLGPMAASFVGRSLLGAADGAAGDAVSELITTRHLNARSVLLSAGIGAIFGGRTEGGSSRTPAESEESLPAASCRAHSFAPDTPVLMADGTVRPIKDITIGDHVLSTDPTTATTTSGTVEALHLNHDTALTDVTVNTGGQLVTLHTTQHHPFWDQSSKQWRNAADLQPGLSTLVAPDGQTIQVVDVRNFTDGKDMRDLTVTDIHTYYVIAGSTPVLVHNCPAGDGSNITIRVVRSDGSADPGKVLPTGDYVESIDRVPGNQNGDGNQRSRDLQNAHDSGDDMSYDAMQKRGLGGVARLGEHSIGSTDTQTQIGQIVHLPNMQITAGGGDPVTTSLLMAGTAITAGKQGFRRLRGWWQGGGD